MSIKKSAIVLALTLLTACSFNEPKLPSWDAEWTLWLPTQNFEFSEVVDDSILFADTTQSGIPIVAFTFEDSTDWERVTYSDLAIDEQTDSYQAEIGIVEVGDANDAISDTAKISSFLGPEFQGTIIPPYPAFDVNPEDDSLSFDHFEEAGVHSGNIWLTFHNNMFLEIAAGMTIDVYNISENNELLGTLVFNDPIPSGTSATSDVIDLSGKTVNNEIRISYSIPISGSDSIRTLSEDEQKQIYFITSLSMDRLLVDWARADIPVQEFNRTDSMEVTEEDVRLRSAKIHKGQGRIHLNNQLPVNVNTVIELPQFIKGNQHKVIEQYLQAGQQYDIQLELSGWSLENSGEFIDYVVSEIIAITDSTEEPVTISSTDFISADIELDSLYFESFDGEINNMTFDIEPTENTDFDFFADFDGSINFDDLEMNLVFENEVDLPVTLDLNIAVYREENGQVVASDSLQVTETIQKNSVSPTTKITLDENYSSPSIGDLVSILPTKIKFYGTASLDGSGSVSANEGLRVNYTVYSAISLSIDSMITYVAEIDSLTEEELDEDTRKTLSEDIQEAYATLQLTNGLPIEAEIYLYLATDSLDLGTDEIADSSKKMIIHGSVVAGETDANGYVDNPQGSVVEIPLSKNQLQIFKTTPLYSSQKLIVHPSSGTIRFRQTDEIKVDAAVKVKYRVDPESE